MKLFLTLLILCITSGAFAQKTVKVGKGKIKVNDELVAEYDGKGSAFRNGEYAVIIPGSETPLINLVEVNHNFFNPLLDETHYFYEVKFSTGQTCYIRPKPNTGKAFGREWVRYGRKFGNDLLEELFNDTVPLIVVDKVLNKENIDKFIAQAGYPFEAVKASAKALEDSIAQYAKEPIARDTKKPVSLQLIPNISSSGSSWFTIIQDNKVIGRVYKYNDERVPRASYQVWKKAPAGAMLQGKAAEFIPVAITKEFGYSPSKQYEAIKVVGKEKLGFTSANQMAAENDFINAAIAAGFL